MNTALQLMLIQPLDDDLERSRFLLFPSWPCSWDVDFKLHAPRNTVVSGRLVNGALQDLVVFPEERKEDIIFMSCKR